MKKSNTIDVVELNRIAAPKECERLAGGVSWDTLRRNFPEKIVQISPRRSGMRVRDLLQLNDDK